MKYKLLLKMKEIAIITFVDNTCNLNASIFNILPKFASSCKQKIITITLSVTGFGPFRQL